MRCRDYVMSPFGRYTWRRSAALAAGLGLVLLSLSGGPAAAQSGGASDAIDRSRELSTRPMPKAPPPEQPTERVLPESPPREIVIPPNLERTPTDRPWPAPPPTSYGTPSGTPPRIPGR